MIDVQRRMQELIEENKALKAALEKAQSELAESVRCEIEYAHEVTRLRNEIRRIEEGVMSPAKGVADFNVALSQHDHGV